MRALVCKEYGPPEPDALVVEDVDDPAPGKGQVLVDVEAAGINFPDVLTIAGQYQVKAPLPFVPGNEGAGIVSAVGAGVTQFAAGDKLIFTTRGGAFAEKCVADAHSVAPLPDVLNFEQGAGFAVTYGTSYHALKQSARLQPGESNAAFLKEIQACAGSGPDWEVPFRGEPLPAAGQSDAAARAFCRRLQLPLSAPVFSSTTSRHTRCRKRLTPSTSFICHGFWTSSGPMKSS